MDSLKEARRAMRIRVYSGTTDSFRVMLSNQCTALHFSGESRTSPARDLHQRCAGHGIVDRLNRDHLIFENTSGCAHMVDTDTLAKLLYHGTAAAADDSGFASREQRRLKLVVLAACNSLGLGRVFRSAGVPFVVCVRREEKVLDNSSITFSRSFYHALLSGEPVPSAFKVTQRSVSLTSTALTPTPADWCG